MKLRKNARTKESVNFGKTKPNFWKMKKQFQVTALPYFFSIFTDKMLPQY